MRLVLSWLRDFVEVDVSTADLAAMLDMRGFEVAATETIDGGDAVIDFEITANRPDCLSVIGLAREVATAYDRPLRLPSSAPQAGIPLAALEIGESDRLQVTIDDPERCPRYAAAIGLVTPGARTPGWMASRLQAAGVRPISPIVDITNYVLLELGQPTHAFDLERLAGPEIRARRARAGEVVRTLDGVQRKLDADMLVIADRDRAQAVAGVMGGADSEISSSTRSVVFESAYFQPASVRRTSKRLGLKTEASARFERGADANGAAVALQRIAALMAQIGAGTVAAPIVDRYPGRRLPRQIHLREQRTNALLGVTVPAPDVQRILRGLGMSVEATADGWDVVAPTYRVDVAREADLIEEVGRHYGFDKLPDTFPVMTVPAPPPDPRIPRDRLARKVLTASGLSEAVTFGFVEKSAAEPFSGAGAVGVANPLSALFDTLRPSLIPGLVDSVAHNRRHGQRDVRLFEIGTRFAASGETRAVGLALTGAAMSPHWSAPPRDVDFFDVKGIVERLADALGVAIRWSPAREAYLVAGQTASILAGTSAVGVIGQLLPTIADSRGIPRQDAVIVAELDLDAIDAEVAEVERLRADASDATRPLPRFPFVVRDLSIVVSDALPAEIIRGTIQTAGRDLRAPLVSIAFFDRYQGKGVPSGSVSLSLRLTFQAADRTLTDAEVQQSFETILAALVREHHAVQR